MIFRVYLHMAILTGFILGLGTLLFIGPVLFYLLKSAMESGFKAGISVALGIVAGDFICAALALYGAQSFLKNNRFEFWTAILGGLDLVCNRLKIRAQSKFKYHRKRKNKTQIIRRVLPEWLLD